MQIFILCEFIHWGLFITADFTEEKYKEIFSHCVHLADNTVRILMKADIINMICNTYWPLNFNTNRGVCEGSSACWTHYSSLSLNEHDKLQIFLNCSFHGKHDLTDSKILPITTLFKNITVIDSKSDIFSVILTLTSTKITKLIHNCVVNQSSLSKNTEHKGYLLISFSLLLTLSINYKSIFNQADITEDEEMRLLSVLSFSSDQINLTDDEEELTRLSDEDNSMKMNKLVLLCNCVNQLKTEVLKRAHHADKKITFLTLADACLNEVLMMQSQDAVKAGQFIKDLFNEPAIKTDKVLVNKITTLLSIHSILMRYLSILWISSGCKIRQIAS